MGIDASADIFPPARSFGWVWLLALLAMIVAPLGMLFIPGAFEGEDAVGAWITIALLLPLDLYVLVVLLSVPKMRYELGIDALVLR